MRRKREGNAIKRLLSHPNLSQFDAGFLSALWGMASPNGAVKLSPAQRTALMELIERYK
jgi:hypothetical protein